jgi:hypothetical protein
MGCWMGLITSFDFMEFRNMACPYRESNPGRPARIYSDYASQLYEFLVCPLFLNISNTIEMNGSSLKLSSACHLLLLVCAWRSLRP